MTEGNMEGTPEEKIEKEEDLTPEYKFRADIGGHIISAETEEDLNRKIREYNEERNDPAAK